MSDRGRYRKVYARVFSHPGFVRLTDGEKVLALYLLAGPQSNRLGLYKLSLATAAEDLGNVPQTLAKRLANVCLTFGWWFDADARVFYIPSWWRWNRPENANVLKGSLKDLNELPPSGLIDRFAADLGNVPETLRQTFLEGLREHLPERSPTQDQYQYQDQDQEQKQDPALRAKSGRDGGVPPHVTRIAKQVLRDARHTEDTEYLIDATIATCKAERIDVNRQVVIAALAAVTPHARGSSVR